MSPSPLCELGENLDPEPVMRALNYKNRQAFMNALPSLGIPYIRVNSRKILIPRAGYNDWLARRTVGGKRNHQTR